MSMISLVLIVIDEARDAANAALEGAGLAPDTCAIALSATGLEPATHWMGRSYAPDEWAAPEVAGLTIDAQETGDPWWHARTTLEAAGLVPLDPMVML